MRMKTLANLASDAPGKKRRRGGDDDNFGANDEDWGVYRTVAMGDQSEDDEEEDLDAEMTHVEAQLLKHDPGFNESKTMAAQKDWTKSLLHAFLRGPQPFDTECQQETHQLHLNVERIRVPEVVFQPAIAGLDQAGIVNIAADMVNHGMRNHDNRISILKDVFLTGGNTLFKGFEERLSKDLRPMLPLDASMHVRRAKDPLLDAWKGAAQWSKGPTYRQARVTREEFLEKGSEYLKVGQILMHEQADNDQTANIPTSGSQSGQLGSRITIRKATANDFHQISRLLLAVERFRFDENKDSLIKSALEMLSYKWCTMLGNGTDRPLPFDAGIPNPTYRLTKTLPDASTHLIRCHIMSVQDLRLPPAC